MRRYNEHILDWLFWQLHPGATLNQMRGNFPLAVQFVYRHAKPTPFVNLNVN